MVLIGLRIKSLARIDYLPFWSAFFTTPNPTSFTTPQCSPGNFSHPSSACSILLCGVCTYGFFYLKQYLHPPPQYPFSWFNFTYLLCTNLRVTPPKCPSLPPSMTRLGITITPELSYHNTCHGLYFISRSVYAYRYGVVELPNSLSITLLEILNLTWQTSEWSIDKNSSEGVGTVHGLSGGKKLHLFFTNHKLKFIISFQNEWMDATTHSSISNSCDFINNRAQVFHNTLRLLFKSL